MHTQHDRTQKTTSCSKWLMTTLVALLSTQCAAQTQLVIQVPSDMIPETDLQSVTIKVTRLDAQGQPMPIPITEQTLQIGLAATGGKKTIPLELGVFAARADDSRRVLVTVSGRRVSGAQAQTSAVVAFFPNKTVFYTLYLSGACTPAVNEACEQRGLACGMEGGMQGICVERIRSTAVVFENGARREVPVLSGTNGSDADVPSVDATVDAMGLDVSGMDNVNGTVDVTDVIVPDDDGLPIDPNIPAPRPIAPMSTSTVSSHQVPLRWELLGATTGARLRICRDRAMSDRCLPSVTVAGSSTTAQIPGDQSGWFYWSIAGRTLTAKGNRSSLVWQFWVRARDAMPRGDTVLPPPVDFNSDGFADMAIGAPGTNGFQGAVSVYSGSVMGPGPLPNILSGPVAGATFGFSVAGAGDVNGDGFSDLIVGAVGASQAMVYHGHAIGPLTLGSTLVGVVGEGLGGSVASAGDVNGDGFGDVIVGAPSVGSVIPAPGSAKVYLGGPNGVLTSVHATLRGIINGDTFGSSVAGGDLNGDGYSDVVIGAPLFNAGGVTHAGGVTIYYGSAMGIVDMQVAQVLLGGTLEFKFGHSVAVVGDMNGDSLADIVVGSPTSVAHGEVTLVRGASPRVIDPLPRNSFSAMGADRFGTSVASAGDVNNDGLADLIVGAPERTLMGPGTGTATVFLSNGVSYTEMQSSALSGVAGGLFGTSVAGVGDMDGDGYGEVIVGEPAANLGQGRALVFTGARGGTNPGNPVILNGGMQLADQFGQSVAWLGLRSRRRRVWITQSL